MDVRYITMFSLRSANVIFSARIDVFFLIESKNTPSTIPNFPAIPRYSKVCFEESMLNKMLYLFRLKVINLPSDPTHRPRLSPATQQYWLNTFVTS